MHLAATQAMRNRECSLALAPVACANHAGSALISFQPPGNLALSALPRRSQAADGVAAEASVCCCRRHNVKRPAGNEHRVLAVVQTLQFNQDELRQTVCEAARQTRVRKQPRSQAALGECQLATRRRGRRRGQRRSTGRKLGDQSGKRRALLRPIGGSAGTETSIWLTPVR